MLREHRKDSYLQIRLLKSKTWEKKEVKLLSRVRLFGPHELYPTRLIRPWSFPGNSPGVGFHFLLQGIFPTQGSNPGLLHCRQTLYSLSYQGSPCQKRWRMEPSQGRRLLTFTCTTVKNGFHCCSLRFSRVLSRFSRVRLFVTPWTVAHQAPLSMELSRQEPWSG